jgi:hypothetical protein
MKTRLGLFLLIVPPEVFSAEIVPELVEGNVLELQRVAVLKPGRPRRKSSASPDHIGGGAKNSTPLQKLDGPT